jgi:hypothetical protein
MFHNIGPRHPPGLRTSMSGASSSYGVECGAWKILRHCLVAAGALLRANSVNFSPRADDLNKN